jgi:hypothetical protein
LNHVPAANDIAGGDLFKDDAANGSHVQSIDFDQVAGLRHRILLGFPLGIGTRPESATRSRNFGARRFYQSALLLESTENAAHHGNRNRHLLAA